MSRDTLLCPLCGENGVPLILQERINDFSKVWTTVQTYISNQNPVRSPTPIPRNECPLCYSNKKVISNHSMTQEIWTFMNHYNNILSIASKMTNADLDSEPISLFAGRENSVHLLIQSLTDRRGYRVEGDPPTAAHIYHSLDEQSSYDQDD